MSVTVQVTVFFLMMRRPPRSSPFPATTLFRSVADGAPRATLLAVHLPLSAVTGTSLGQVIEGLSGSGTKTFWGQLCWLACILVTIQVTVLVPAGYGSLASFTTLATPPVSLLAA